jgi:hypothetical protein
LFALLAVSLHPPSACQVIETDAAIADIHANSERFEPKSELSFKYLQVRGWVCCELAEAVAVAVEGESLPVLCF